MEEYPRLTAKKNDLDLQIAGLRAEKKRIAKQMEDLAVPEEAKRRVEAMSDSERSALAQALIATGIESEEKVGLPGAGILDRIRRRGR